MKKADLGFGTLRLQYDGDNKSNIESLFDEYMEGDFCYFDIHPGYVLGNVQKLIKEMVVDRYPRNSYMIGNKCPYYNINYSIDYEIMFYNELYECGVEYFDYYMLHAVTNSIYQMHERLGAFPFFIRMKELGVIKKFGISFHDKAEILEKILNKYHRDIDFVQLQINFIDWDSEIIDSKRCYEVACKYNKEIIVMTPIKGGSYLENIMIENEIITIKKLVELSLQFVASLKNVSIILSGMINKEQIIQNRKILKKDIVIDTKKLKKISNEISKNNLIQCTSCNYCIRECPKNINIPQVISLLNQKIKMGEKSLGGKYLFYERIVNNRGQAGDCIACKLCESKCPQKIQIASYMKEASNLFEDKILEMNRKINVMKTENNNLSNKNTVILVRDWKDKEIAIWGIGNCFKKNYGEVVKFCNPKYICDSNKNNQGRQITENLKCVSPIELKDKNIYVIIMAYRIEIVREIEKELNILGINDYSCYQEWIKSCRRT